MPHPASNFTANPGLCLLTPTLWTDFETSPTDAMVQTSS